MLSVTDQEFNDLIAQSLDELPEEYTSLINNLLITYEDEPTPDQRVKLKLHPGETLFGLYEGVPLTNQAAAGSIFNPGNAVAPGRITIFKLPMLRACNSMDELRAQVKHTLWHEVAHYFGLGHDRIHKIESDWK